MKKSWWLCFLFLPILMTSCGTENTTEVINEKLEEAIEKEVEFEAEGERMYDYEIEEKSLYKKIIELGADDQDELQSLSEDASELVNKREESIEQEKSIIEDSKDIFEQMEPKVAEVADKAIKKELEKMVDVMGQRYRAYDEVYDEYHSSLALTKELYNYMGDEEASPDRLYTQIEKVNDSYESVTEANDAFNEKTSAFNELKASYLSLLKKSE